jgi:mannose-6-phosphate isomerase-like protein (cupin superfamily)
MNRIFRTGNYFTVRDGTAVSPFLNATDTKQPEVPWGLLGEMSIAAGRIRPGVQSSIHIHPAVTQVTYLLAGRLTIRMRDAAAAEYYDLALQAGCAVVSQPGTLFQLRNDSDRNAEVLYIVSPSYVFEMEGHDVRHDDAILVARAWKDLASSSFEIPQISHYEARARREESLRRLMQQKAPLTKRTDEAVHPLKREYDYLAPDGSEIRELVVGERSSLAHCMLPAGRTSAPVRHRTVEELWYVLAGAGEISRSRDGETPHIVMIVAGDSFSIPIGTTFQFRAAPNNDLKLLIATTPKWPGAQEAVPSVGGFDTRKEKSA